MQMACLKGKRRVAERGRVATFARVFQKSLRFLALLAVMFLASCTTRDTVHKMVVSVPDQKMALYRKGQLMKVYDVSTSKFCVSCREGSYGTPLGKHEVAKKIGAGQPQGMKFSSRRPTGEIVQPNAPGRDPIVSRILWLSGKEAENRNTYSRCIYIHGTAEEWRIGTPASYGCIRMRSRDVMNLFNTVGVGASVDIVNAPLALPGSQPSVEVSGGNVANVGTSVPAMN